MSGNIVGMTMNRAIYAEYPGKTWNEQPTWKLTTNFISDNKGKTLVFVASVSNSIRQVETFEKELKDYIIFKSKKSVNGNSGHGSLPRNTLYIVDIPK